VNPGWSNEESSGQEMQSAYMWIRNFGDHINQYGTSNLDPDAIERFNLTQGQDGTFSGQQVFEDGTALSLVIGYTSEGTLRPTAACAMIKRDDVEIARIDWNENANRPRDKTVHTHIGGKRNHIYMDKWKEALLIIKQELSKLIPR